MPTRSGSDIITANLTQEIAEHQEAVATLMEREKRYRSLIENSLLGILMNHDAKPLFVNHTWAAIHDTRSRKFSLWSRVYR
ncbi:hypothetical protein C2W62_11305 [Candidatus Entotheonella serta]|nr:hypothetical protein C2W62_11305 [Candidatus Entotheonella serta]